MLSVSLTPKASPKGADGIFGKGGTDAKVFITLHDEDGQSSPEYALNGELQPGEGKLPRRSENPAAVPQIPQETFCEGRPEGSPRPDDGPERSALIARRGGGAVVGRQG